MFEGIEDVFTECGEVVEESVDIIGDAIRELGEGVEYVIDGVDSTVNEIGEAIEDFLGFNETNEDSLEANGYDQVSWSDEEVVEQTAEMYYVEGLGEVVVSGRPLDNVNQLDYAQGDNSYNAQGCCGLVSSSNFLDLCGFNTTEEELVGFAMENGLCNTGDWFTPPSEVGGTNDYCIETIIEAYGIPCTSYMANYGGSIENIAEAVEDGRVATIGVNAGYLWGDANYIADGSANHQITVTGAVRDLNGEVVGLVVCDSGRGLESDATRVLTMDELENCYENAAGASVIISDYPMR